MNRQQKFKKYIRWLYTQYPNSYLAKFEPAEADKMTEQPSAFITITRSDHEQSPDDAGRPSTDQAEAS